MSGEGKASGLTPGELRRYGRQMLLPEIGSEGQARLKRTSVLVVGAGGLGSPATLYLAAAGIGRIGIADPDTVDESNLHRQILYGAPDVGRPKAEAAAEALARLNPDVSVTAQRLRLDKGNAPDIIRPYDIVIDATDNFEARYAINDACVRLGKPDISGSVFGFEGQVSVFWAGRGPCYRCLYPSPPPPAVVPQGAHVGVIGFVPGLVGLVQAAEAVKLGAGAGRRLVGRLVLVDALSMTFREMRVERDPSCAACGRRAN